MEIKLLLYSLCALSPLVGWATGSDQDEPVVDTPLGRVRGYRLTSRAGRQFIAFSGLPYAQPPVGHFRFEPPRPALPWTGTREAKEDGPLCLQVNTFQLNPRARGVEDCLYLSLYTHNVSRKVPVMVHYHGGGFVSGNGARNTNPHFLMDEDIVIVNVNYRVGIAGFFSLEDSVMPGNQGMKDQVEALRWVRRNIASFGGDPGCVTIVGESAGSQSVYHHTVSPLSRGLFHRAISESGTSYNLGSLMPKGYVRDVSLRLANMTNCSRNSSQEIVACLRSIPAEDLAIQIVKYRQWQIDPIATFRVVFEEGPDAFLTFPMEKWTHQPVPYLMGTASGDGLLRTSYFIYYNMSWEWYTEHFNEVAPISLGYFVSASEPDRVTNQIRKYYLPKKDITIEDWPQVAKMYTDAWYTMAIMNGADEHSGDVFFYYFDYLGEHSLAGNLNRTLLTGAFHTDEIIYLWNLTMYSNLTGQDLILSKKLVKLWTNFAKFGSPTPKGIEFSWRKWTRGHHHYLNISNVGFEMREGLAKDRYRFWNRLNYRDNYRRQHYKHG